MTDPSGSSEFADGVAHVDGVYVPISQARIPIMDRGFTRSDATYDAETPGPVLAPQGKRLDGPESGLRRLTGCVRERVTNLLEI